MTIIEKLIDEKKILPTGSRFFEVETITSDYDYFTDFKTFEYIKNNYIHKNGSYSKSIYIDENNMKYNIICINNKYFKTWIYTSRIIKYLCLNDNNYKQKIKNKNIRYSLFESLLGILHFLK